MSGGFNSSEGIPNGATVTQGSGGNSGPPSGDFWDTVTIGATGAVVSDNAHPAHGTQSHKFSTGGTSAVVSVAKTVPAAPTYYIRSSPFTWSSFSLNPTLGRLRSGGGATDVGRIRVNSSGKLQIINAAASAVATSTTTLTTGTQYRVEYFFTQGASSTAEIKLFAGVDDPLGSPLETLTASAQNFGTADIDTIQFGQVVAALNLPPLWLDDMAWSDLGYMGPAELITPPPPKWLWYPDRRVVPQQPARISSVGLLDTALLEDPLLSGADDRRLFAAVDRRSVPQQRLYVSDPSLLAAVVADVPAPNPVDVAAYADRRQAPTQPRRISPDGLLATAQLENALLGSGQQGEQYTVAATHAARRWTPQQPRRDALTPGLLDSALLENELLGAADVIRKLHAPATHAPRWWMPRQPRREALTPGLLDQALLEAPLLSGADDRRIFPIADRRSAPQQRPYVSDPSLLAPVVVDVPAPNPTDLAPYVDRRWTPAQGTRWSVPGLLDTALLEEALLGGADAGRRQIAATHADRREAPVQRLYISDPSFYPIPGLTDPITLAFGAGGHMWLLLNQAALLVDRRAVPQQRQYESDPQLLDSALLEGPLLGGDQRRRVPWIDRRQVPQQRTSNALPGSGDPTLGAGDTVKRYLVAATHVSRRVAGQQRQNFDVALVATALLEGVLLGGADLPRRHAAAYVDRREAPTQRRYLSDPSFYPLPVVTDPLTLAWGTGGHYWLLYHTAALLVDRRVAGQQRMPWFPAESHDCDTPPGFTGVTVYAFAGTAPTFTGATSDPGPGSTAPPYSGVTDDPC